MIINMDMLCQDAVLAVNFDKVCYIHFYCAYDEIFCQ
jgi:hypothetical protein